MIYKSLKNDVTIYSLSVSLIQPWLCIMHYLDLIILLKRLFQILHYLKFTASCYICIFIYKPSQRAHSFMIETEVFGTQRFGFHRPVNFYFIIILRYFSFFLVVRLISCSCDIFIHRLLVY